jgi:hypothetical protein
MWPEIQLVFFVTLLSFVLTYAWWVRFRVWMLREDLFAIRDGLWDAMREQGTLDDPEHRRVRDEINNLIRIAPLFSVWTVISIAIETMLEKGNFDFLTQRCDSPIVQKAREAFIRRVSRYLLFEALSGLFFFFLVTVVIVRVGQPLRAGIEKFMAVMGRVYGSLPIREESREIGEVASASLMNI